MTKYSYSPTLTEQIRTNELKKRFDTLCCCRTMPAYCPVHARLHDTVMDEGPVKDLEEKVEELEEKLEDLEDVPQHIRDELEKYDVSEALDAINEKHPLALRDWLGVFVHDGNMKDLLGEELLKMLVKDNTPDDDEDLIG